MVPVDTTPRLAKLRELMRGEKVDIYGEFFFLDFLIFFLKPPLFTRNSHPKGCVDELIANCCFPVVPSEDAHSSEYICAADARRGMFFHNGGKRVPGLQF